MLKIEEIKRNYSLTSWGTGGAGYYEHRGVTVVLSDGSEINCYYGYSSQGYGTFKEAIADYSHYELNGRMLAKHQQYANAVRDHFTQELEPKLEKLFGKEFKSISAVKRSLKNWYYI